MEWNEEPLSDAELDALLPEWKVEGPLARLTATKLHQPRRLRIAGGSLLALAALLAAAFFVARPRRPPVVTEDVPAGFTPIPYTLPLADGESESVVRMNVPVAALASTGLRIPAADPSAIVTADVIVGADGRARAVRLVSAVSGGIE